MSKRSRGKGATDKVGVDIKQAVMDWSKWAGPEQNISLSADMLVKRGRLNGSSDSQP